jgi:hypothetical protein
LSGRRPTFTSRGDIETAYRAASTGVAQLSNARSLVLRLHGHQVGFKISFDLSGLTISLK